jgi:hypothetical protein
VSFKTELAFCGDSALGAAAASTELQTGDFAIYFNFSWVDIRRPRTVGVPL